MKIAAIIDQAKREKDFNLICKAIPYAVLLGISASEQEGLLVARLKYLARNLGNPALPALHGGVVGAFLETSAILELLWAQETASVPKIFNLTIDYLRPAGPKDSFACGRVTKQGRRIANVFVEAWQEDRKRPIATANCHFLLPTGGPARNS